MKLKATKKSIKEGYNKIISIGYCDAQTLLRGKDAFAYSAGSFGWCCDYYDVEGICISTGYNPVENGVKVDYELIREYEAMARKVDVKTWEEEKKLLGELLSEFVKKAVV